MIQPGIYGENKLLGAKVSIVSSPGYELFGEDGNDKTYIIKKIDYRVTLDGKLSGGFIVEGLENSHYPPGDLQVIELPVCDK